MNANDTQMDKDSVIYGRVMKVRVHKYLYIERVCLEGWKEAE